jgi:hypothetical protein
MKRNKQTKYIFLILVRKLLKVAISEQKGWKNVVMDLKYIMRM